MNNLQLNAALVANTSFIGEYIADKIDARGYNHARAELISAINEAKEGGFTWQEDTGSDLCAALGHATLDRFVEHVVGFNKIKEACNRLSSYEDEDGICYDKDYSLPEVAALVGGDVDGDGLILGKSFYPMDGERWLEMGHQYSLFKQWWPEI